MAVSGITPLGGVIPICSDCGIRLCWELSEQEYEERKEYWDNWKCEVCDEHYFADWRKNHRNQHKNNL